MEADEAPETGDGGDRSGMSNLGGDDFCKLSACTGDRQGPRETLAAKPAGGE